MAGGRRARAPGGSADIPPDLVQGPERSALFWFLHERHEALEKLWRGRRVDWVKVSAWAAGSGGLDRTGKPASPLTARKTWARVRALAARERAEREAKRRPPRTPTPARGAAPEEAARSRPADAQTTKGSDAGGEGLLDNLTATIKRRSRGI